MNEIQWFLFALCGVTLYVGVMLWLFATTDQRHRECARLGKETAAYLAVGHPSPAMLAYLDDVRARLPQPSAEWTSTEVYRVPAKRSRLRAERRR